jgi:EAL domain-containing protein (putative c-di-GMP-specific phosphodiesterase class I)
MAFDHIKIDGSLLSRTHNDPERERLLAAVIGLGASLDLEL